MRIKPWILRRLTRKSPWTSRTTLLGTIQLNCMVPLFIRQITFCLGWSNSQKYLTKWSRPTSLQLATNDHTSIGGKSTRESPLSQPNKHISNTIPINILYGRGKGKSHSNTHKKHCHSLMCLKLVLHVCLQHLGLMESLALRSTSLLAR